MTLNEFQPQKFLSFICSMCHSYLWFNIFHDKIMNFVRVFYVSNPFFILFHVKFLKIMIKNIFKSFFSTKVVECPR